MVKIHKCLICDLKEECKEENCNFMELLSVHGACLARAKNVFDNMGEIIDSNAKKLGREIKTNVMSND